MNTEQKHSPGPWLVDYAQGIIAADETVVAYVEADHSDTPTPDGNLIAAAPDLLEALEHYISTVPPRCTDGDEKWHKARAAIAKAKP